MIENRFYTQEEYYGLIQDEEAHIEYDEGRVIQMSPISEEHKDAYEKSGIPEYWIVDPIYQNIDVCILEENRYSVYSFVEDDVINAGFFKDYGLSLSRIFSAGDIFEGLI
ncbi:MAG: Uma2 family endonuclease [Peptococcaceae bacterium]|nr:Uma2 family endonuclease [Peptococcaceae bacterium]